MKIFLKNINPFIDINTYKEVLKTANQCNAQLHTTEGKGADFLGWVDLAGQIRKEEIDSIKATAARLRQKCELVIVIGIGGSYLGAKAVIDALSDPLKALSKTPKKDPIVVYAGHNISAGYLSELLELVGQYETGVICISKSGTTTEPAIAFRLIKEAVEARYGKAAAAERIVAITDAHKGALREVADTEGYETFVIPDDVGGRYSVLTPVGLLPIAVAGHDIQLLIDGAQQMEKECAAINENNIAAMYAAARNTLYRNGKKIEILATFEPRLQYFAEWWKQLYGESEGKQGKGLFPASVVFSTDLHSMGQYIQEGERDLFETFLSVETTKKDITLTANPQNTDKLNFLAGRDLSEINRTAEQGTILAHVDGGVPCIEIKIEKLDEMNIGSLIYFFEKACGISGYLLGINPFDQPGVEAYKNNMYALLGKPGYEALRESLEKRL